METGTLVAVIALCTNLVVHLVAAVKFGVRLQTSTSDIQHSLDNLAKSVDQLRHAVDGLDRRIDEHDIRLAVIEANRISNDGGN